MTNGLVQHIKVEESTSYAMFGRTLGAPYRGYGYIPLRFEGGVVRRMGTQHNNSSYSMGDALLYQHEPFYHEVSLEASQFRVVL